jgi:hypothetical protein
VSQHPILSLVVPLAAVLAAWLGLWALFTGLGHGLLRAVYPDQPEGMAAGAASWLGYCGAVIFLQAWHLLFAVDWRALATLSALSIAGWLSTAGGRRQTARPRSRQSARPRGHWGMKILVALALLWLADRAIGPYQSYDGANYHLQTIRWNHEHAAVPGLANLNPAYGLAGSALLVPALLECGVLEGRSQHFVNSFLIALLLTQVGAGVAGFLRRNEPGAFEAASLVLLLPLLLQLDDGAVATHNTDTAVSVAIYAAVLLACASLSRPGSDAADARPGISPELFAAFSLLAVAPCLKATCAVFAAATWLGLALIVACDGRRPAAWRLLPSAGLALGALIPWVAGNAILTGYPLYPLPPGALQVDWRLPRFHLDGLLWWTRGFAFTPEAWDLMVSRQGFNWLPYWLRFELRTAVFEILLPLSLIVVLAGIWCVTRRRFHGRAAVGYLLCPVGFAIAAWFLVAPAVRFGQFMFWSAAALLAAAVLPAPLLAWRQRRRAAALLLAAWALSPLLLQAYFVVKHRQGGGALAALQDRFLVPPGPDHGLYPLLHPAMQDVTVCAGLVVHRPAAPDSLRDTARWAEALPWDAPLPATAALLPQLCPRRPGELQAGFRIPPLSASWARVNAGSVRRLRDQTGWSVGRLAVHFVVRPEMIQESLALHAP